jgi:3-deoxy-manno-octulosonate cytidylyltransferase (CMP-KDO synthetase)
MRLTVIIPARLGSSRLPNKPLADIAGRPMVVRVAQRVLEGDARGTRVVVATDSDLVVQACAQFGIESVITQSGHPSGSDRLAEASRLLKLDDEELVVNVQGDEPLIAPALVQSVGRTLVNAHGASMATAAHAITSVQDFANPNVVKVVTDARGLAMYFTRAPIPWWRDGFAHAMDTLPTPAPLRHIGIYCYHAGFLRLFPQLAQAPIEQTEALEQLRVLWHGYRIAVHLTDTAPGPGVDTESDLQRVRMLFLAQHAAH